MSGTNGPLVFFPLPPGPAPPPATGLQAEAIARQSGDAINADAIAAETARAEAEEAVLAAAINGGGPLMAQQVLHLDLSAMASGADPGFGRLWMNGIAVQIGSAPALAQTEDASGYWQLEDGSGRWEFA